MEVKVTKKLVFVLISLTILLNGCMVAENLPGKQYGIFWVQDDGKTVIMNSHIRGSTLKNFNQMMEDYPNINLIKMMDVPGSVNDKINLLVAKRVHELGLSIHIMDYGLIASGGTDFFLAGKKRTVGHCVRIGVHSWAKSLKQTATDFPKGHEYHLPYINYYKSVGFDQQWAEDFYYYTINSAPASDVHWMTDEEITKYGMLAN